MIRLTYDPRLAEQTVLLAERTAPLVDARAFRDERDRIYSIRDDDCREAGFRDLHQRWFVRWALHGPIERALLERVDVSRRLTEGRVLAAFSLRDEGADLLDRVTPRRQASGCLLVIRLRPETLIDPGAAQRLLRHELIHVADMLDPRFGYDRRLPASDDGSTGDLVTRDRYRVLWDVTIDGRLVRAGLAQADVRARRWIEFSATFAALGDGRRAAFDDWFETTAPTHQGLLAFARARVR